MRELPIPFTAPMVRAILAGTKTQTRRVMRPQPFVDDQGNACWKGINFGQDGRGPLFRSLASSLPSSRTGRVHCPYGKPGDKLWVREPWATLASEDHLPPRECSRDVRFYEAEHGRQRGTNPRIGKPRPGMFMPRWHSRLTLENAGVRVERLHDINEADAIAEGIVPLPGQDGEPGAWWTADVSLGAALHGRTPVAAYMKLWEHINGRGSWALNPWLWVIDFRRLP